MSIWILYGIIAAFFASLVAIFAKIGLSQVDSTLATTIRAVTMAAFLLLVSFFSHKTAQSGNLDSKALTFIILSGIAGAISWLFYFLALKQGPTTGVASLDKLSLVFIFILSFLILKEPFNIKTLIGVAIVTLGTFLTIK